MKYYQKTAIISVRENKLFCETFFKSSDAVVVRAVDYSFSLFLSFTGVVEFKQVQSWM